jgi:hypothetical protein
MNTKTPGCWASEPQAQALRIEISQEQSILLPFDQFAFAQMSTDRTEQQLRLVFATHEILVRGRSLRRIETALQTMELSFLAVVPQGHQALISDGSPIILEIQVNEVGSEPRNRK